MPKRRNITDVITEERVMKMAKRVNLIFHGDLRSVPPPIDAEETERRRLIVLRAANRTMLGALVYLAEHKSAILDALLIAGSDYARAALRGEPTEFVVRRKAIQMPDFIRYPGILSLHEYVTNELRSRWMIPAQSAERYTVRQHHVSKRGRFGSPQKLGARRSHLIREGRVETVRNMLREFYKQANVPEREVAESAIRKWVRIYKPAELSHQIIAFMHRTTPRQVKKLLNEARKYMKAAELHGQIFELWASAGAGRNQSTPP